ncbi:hypothetical protein A2V82_11850 [candidate division KSB1 bacterium RBG_16_48_16]|nr:MAG: hypothetical protein A2V82_11850 [candidate division KSB1 bacterium RBG_16_48_16]
MSAQISCQDLKDNKMTIDDIHKLLRNPNLIPGIYNYCDRWCERCEFTHRCANFSLEEKHFPDSTELDINNARFWEKLGEIFKITLEMVKDFAEKQGIDLESIDREAFENRERELEDKAANFECSYLSKEYIHLVNNWFDSSHDVFNEKVEELKMLDEIGLPNTKLEKEIGDLNDVTNVIRWYQNQIHVKIMRAVSGKLEEESEAENDFPKDSDGSAKVALIGIDRSISAWGKMLSHFPQKEDELLNVLVHLERLGRKTEKEFPNARAFIRSGFDEK